tara:strand:+ start:133 stop:609 length:477 start_codon:yes stop_codon:yes gene_type:complete
MTFNESIITILIAFIAGIVALYQVKSNVISSARIKWIEDLRLALCEYYDSALRSTLYLEDGEGFKKLGFSDETTFTRLEEHHSRYHLNSNKIRMLLNPNEKQHADLIEIMDIIDQFYLQENVQQISQEKVEEKLKDIVEISRNIMKTEWDKSKKILPI